MPAPNKREGEEKKATPKDGDSSSSVEGSSSEFEDIEEEKPEVVHPPTPKAVASKVLQPTPKGFAAKAAPPVGPPPWRIAIGLESSGSESPAPRPKPPGPTLSKKAASSSSPARPMSSKGGKRGKGKQEAAHQRCEHCGQEVFTQSCHDLMDQHQKWNPNCVTWQYYNKGLSWFAAQVKAGQKLARRQQRSLAPAREETKELAGRKKRAKKVRRRSPTPDVRPPKKDRHHRRDPDNEDREGRRPKIRRQDEHTFILTMPKAR